MGDGNLSRLRVHTVIVHHRGLQLLSRCLRSLLESEGVGLHVVVVLNDCREELPPEAFSERVVVVRTAGAVGFAAANNAGVEAGRRLIGEPDHWLFLNNDTSVDPQALRVLVESLAANPDADIAGPRIMILGAPDHLNSLGINLTMTGEAWDEGIGRPLLELRERMALRPVVAVTGCALMIRAAALRALGGWSEAYGYYYEDLDLCLHCQARGRGVINAPDAVVFHALSATAGVRSEFKLFHTWRNRLVLLAVHWPLSLLVRILPRLLASEALVLWRRYRVGARDEAAIQFRAWRSFAKALPSLPRLRRQAAGRRDWVRLLRPAGSVPEIRLPPIAAEPIVESRP